MLKYFFLYIFIFLACIFFIDLSTSIFSFIIYFSGLFLIFLFHSRKSSISINLIKLYTLVYSLGFLYILICYVYMLGHEFNYLLAYDIENYFMPTVTELLSINNLYDALKYNFSEFNIFNRYQAGYFAYLLPFAYLSDYLNSNLYVSMQFSSLLVGALSSGVVYKLFLVNNFNINKAYNYTIILCVSSILFIYTTILLRDIHVMFLYLLGIYITFNKKFSISSFLFLVLIILISCTLRIETGLFLSVLIPIYLYLTMEKSKNKNIFVGLSLIVFLILFLLVLVSFNNVLELAKNNQEYYIESDKGEGVIATLQSIPILGAVLSIFYNAIQPLPFWLKMDISFDPTRPESYNIMNFPTAISGFFNWIVVSFIGYFLIFKRVRQLVGASISKPLLVNLLVGFIFLYIQSSVISQRRLMAYYVLYYIFFFIIFNKLSVVDRRNLLTALILLYSIFHCIIFLL